MADDFSKVVQQLQLANQKLANLERIQGEGGTAKGIIAAALPEVLNERELFGRDKEFQKDQGITNIDEEQRKTTQVIADKQDALKRSIDGGLQNVTDANFIGPRTLEQQIEEVKIQRAESREEFRQLREIIGDNAKATEVFQKKETEFNKQILALELQNPSLNPSLQKEKEKELLNLQKESQKSAFASLKSAFDAFANPLKKILGSGTGVPGLTVGRLLLLGSIGILIKILRSEQLQNFITFMQGPGGKVLDKFVSGFRFLFTGFDDIATGIQNIAEGETLAGLQQILGGGGKLALALGGILLILAPFKSLIALTGLVTSFVGGFTSIGKSLIKLTPKLKVPLRFSNAVDGFRKAMINAGAKFRGMSRSLGGALMGVPMGGGSPTAGGAGAGGATTTTPKKTVVKQTTGSILKNSLKFGARAASKVALPLAAAFSIFEGVKAANDEFTKSGSFKESIKQGVGGVVESLTFGLISKDSVAKGLTGGSGNPLPDFYQGMTAEDFMTTSPTQTYNMGMTNDLNNSALKKSGGGGGSNNVVITQDQVINPMRLTNNSINVLEHQDRLTRGMVSTVMF
mgnify:FL=1